MYKACIACIISVFFWISPAMAWEGNSDNLWDVLRSDFQLNRNTQDPAVQSEIDWFKHHRKVFNRMALSAVPYLYYIHNEVHKLGLPAEIALIPMIESAYNPRLYSKTGAAGLWQIMPGTGSGLGLHMNYWYDERRDVVASTKAALNYFKKLNQIFSGDWLLSIAAYDSGEGTVQHARQINANQNKDLDFWSLPLPRETQRYVPKLLALVEIIQNPQQYEINLPYIPNKPYFLPVTVTHQLDLDAAAEMAQVPLTDLYRLNPGYNRWATGPGDSHNFLLPVEHAKLFEAHLEHHPLSPDAHFHTHHVKKGEKLSAIAAEYHLDIETLKKANHLASNYVRSGTHLKIPRTNAAEDGLESRKKIILAYQTENIGPHRIMHEVKIQDSIELIAHRYQVTPNAIRFWNHIRADQKIKPGEILIVWTKLTASQVLAETTPIQVRHKALVHHHATRHHRHHRRYG